MLITLLIIRELRMKEVTIEDLYGKLLDLYRDKFPHNPSGVLQLHIDKVVKEGRTKEEAVIDLSKQKGIEVPQKVTGKFPELEKLTPKGVERKPKPRIKGLNEQEYQACLNGLGLLEQEEIRLQYVVARKLFRKSTTSKSGLKVENRKGLLVFTNDNLIFMQQEGIWSSNYSQAIRIPLEQITGMESGGKLMKHIRVRIGVSETDEYEFNFPPLLLERSITEIRDEIDGLLKQIREERKRSAQETLAGRTVPAMIFCKFCGTRNKSDRSHCANCGAPLE